MDMNLIKEICPDILQQHQRLSVSFHLPIDENYVTCTKVTLYIIENPDNMKNSLPKSSTCP